MPDPVVFPLSAQRLGQGARTRTAACPSCSRYLERFLARDRAQVILDNAAADAARTAAYLENNLGVKHARATTSTSASSRSASPRCASSSTRPSASSTSCTSASTPTPSPSRPRSASTSRRSRRRSSQALPGADRRGRRRRRQGVPAAASSRTSSRSGPRSRARSSPRCSRTSPRRSSRSPTRTSPPRPRRSPSGSGPRTPQVEIAVDSFKYDVGVYAVGALGTTVFLFVNTLAGGLLTLAAPILAIVLKSKVAGDIRGPGQGEGARRRCSTPPRRWGRTSTSCIDDFAKRLSEFVSNAGNTLYKGICEILDRTMRERREHGGDVEATEGRRPPTQIQQVRAATAALRQLREGLWSGDTEDAPARAAARGVADHCTQQVVGRWWPDPPRPGASAARQICGSARLALHAQRWPGACWMTSGMRHLPALLASVALGLRRHRCRRR